MSTVRFRLSVLRVARRLSQRRLAALAGLRPDTVSALERGKSTAVHFDTVARICEVLECEPADLLELERDAHRVPVLGGPDEDEIVRERLAKPGRTIDGPSFVAELLKEGGKPDAAGPRRR